jgi:FkbM family methyltransferase
VIRILKRAAALLPADSQATLKRLHFGRQIKAGRFRADEPEALLLHEFLGSGDWAIDVGANVGHYTLAMSALVGRSGRVIAFEPMRTTFAILASNVDLSAGNNVTLINAAASSTTRVVGMDMPKEAETGLDNPYQAHISSGGEYSILALPVDALDLSGVVRLVKIDAEGHELDVLQGMQRLLERDKPTLIIEGDDAGVEAFFSARGYTHRTLPGSWNRIYSWGA